MPHPSVTAKATTVIANEARTRLATVFRGFIASSVPRRRLLARTEKRGTHANDRRAARDGDVEVCRHSHRELGEYGRAAVQVAEQRERLEGPSREGEVPRGRH